VETVSRDFTIDPRRVRILRELRDRGTIGAVADAMHLTPSAVSQQLTRLSQEIGGVPLVSRHGRRVRLTPQADLVLEHAALIGRQHEIARAELLAHAGGQVGRVVVGAFASAIVGLVAPVRAELAARSPGIQVTVEEAEPPGCFTRLDNGELDIVVTADHREAPSRADTRFDRVELLFDPLVAAVPAGAAPAGAEIDLSSLADATWVQGATGGPCSEAGLLACAMAGFTPDIRHRVNEWSAALALVATGAGVALVPSLAIGCPPPGVALRPLSFPPAGRTLFGLVRAGSSESPACRAVLDALCAQGRAVAAETRPPQRRQPGQLVSATATRAAPTGVSQP
jgi:DNA-binding transcriptional LysR family regulator